MVRLSVLSAFPISSNRKKMFPYIEPEQLRPLPLTSLAQSGALLGAVAQWNGLNWAAQQPLLGLQNGATVGRFSELNIIGNAALTLSGNRATLNVTAAANPGVTVNGVGGITNFNFGGGLTALVGPPGTVNVSGSGGGGGGITGIAVNGAGNYTNLEFAGAGVNVAGNVITIPGASGGGGSTTTLTHSGAGTATLFTGTAPNYTMKGMRSLSGSLIITETASTVDFEVSAASLGSINVLSNNTPIGTVQNLNFIGFASVINGGNIANITAPGGGGGSFGVNVNNAGPFSNLTFTGAGVSVSGSTITIPGGGGGGSAGINILNQGAAFMTGVTTLDIWNGTLQNIAPGFARLVLPNGGGGGITGIQINSAGNYTGINFVGGGVSVAGNTVNINGGSSGVQSLVNGTNTTVVNQGGGVWRVDANVSGGGLPSGFQNALMWHNGSQWGANSTMVLTNVTPFFGSNNWRLTNIPSITSHGLSFAASIQLASESHLYLNSNIGDVRINSPSGTIQCAGNSFTCTTSSMGFFGASPISRPSTTNDITSVRNALIALGLIQ